jgi:hypothetical protein
MTTVAIGGLSQSGSQRSILVSLLFIGGAEAEMITTSTNVMDEHLSK